MGIEIEDGSMCIGDGGCTAPSTDGYLIVSGNVGIGATNPAHLLTVAGTVNITGNITLDGTINISSTGGADIFIDPGSGTVFFGDGTAKIDAGVVDPTYVLDGTSYSTYVPSMVGIKEEVTGIMTLDFDTVQNIFIKELDFNNFVQGTDLWVFSQIIDQNISYVTILLTPNTPSNVGYTKDIDNRIITFFSNDASEVSFRLTAPRFDHDRWNTSNPHKHIKVAVAIK